MVRELIFLPDIWHSRLKHVSVPQLLNEIEDDAAKRRAIKMPVWLIFALVKYRVKLSRKWAKSPCLLGCMILAYFLARAGLEITIHFGCQLDNDSLFGHCWISSPQLKGGRFQHRHGMHEIYSKTFVYSGTR